MRRICYTKLLTVITCMLSTGFALAQSTDATLSAINFDSGVLTPDFDPEITKNVALVPDGVDTLSVSAVLNDVNASSVGGGQVEIANKEMTTITVTAEDGSTKKDYVFFLANENCYSPIFTDRANLAPNPLMTELTGYYSGWGSKSINTNSAFVYCGNTSGKISGSNAGSIDFDNVEDVVKDGASYLISAMLYVEGAGKAQIGHTLNGSSVNTQTTKTNEWEEVRGLVDITSLNSNPNLWFNNYGISSSGDNMYVDNFQMSEVNRDNNFKELSSDVGTLVPDFDSNINIYSLIIDAGTSQVNISALQNAASSTVSGDGLITLINDEGMAEVLCMTLQEYKCKK